MVVQLWVGCRLLDADELQLSNTMHPQVQNDIHKAFPQQKKHSYGVPLLQSANGLDAGGVPKGSIMYVDMNQTKKMRQGMPKPRLV